MEKRLIPYSVYLPEEHYKKLKAMAKERKASSMVRDAVVMMINGNDAYTSGYQKGINDAAQVVYECEEAEMVAIKGRDLGAILTERIKELAK